LTSKRKEKSSIHNEVVAFVGSIIEQAKKVLDASNSKEYEGPPNDVLKAIVDGGLAELPKNLRSSGDFGLYASWVLLAHCVKYKA
jgi:hypothetical protein